MTIRIPAIAVRAIVAVIVIATTISAVASKTVAMSKIEKLIAPIAANFGQEIRRFEIGYRLTCIK